MVTSGLDRLNVGLIRLWYNKHINIWDQLCYCENSAPSIKVGDPGRILEKFLTREFFGQYSQETCYGHLPCPLNSEDLFTSVHLKKLHIPITETRRIYIVKAQESTGD